MKIFSNKLRNVVNSQKEINFLGVAYKRDVTITREKKLLERMKKNLRKV